MRARALVLSSLLFAAPAGAADDRVGLIISGGISLGAYQAGVMYARLKDLRARRHEATLELSTGASAGNINTYLTVIGWCDARDERFSLFANPYFDTWINVGIDRLQPSDPDGQTYARLFADQLGSPTAVRVGREVAAAPTPPDAYTPSPQRHGLLTRRAFLAAERYLAERLAGDGYLAGCRVRTAITLTAAEPAALPLAAGDAETNTLRYVVPLTATAQGGRLLITNDGADVLAGDASCWSIGDTGRHPWSTCHPSVGRTLALPEEGGAVPIAALSAMVQAASAFPVAFSPMTLEVCTEGGDPDPRCPSGLSTDRAVFTDGGFFDNVPLGAALEIAHDEDLRRARSGPVGPLQFWYVDPDQRRGGPRLPQDRRRPDGLRAFGDLLGNVVGEARLLELQGLSRHCAHELDQALPGGPAQRRRHCGPVRPPGARSFVATTRFYGITGDLAVNFGAFFHRGFRVYDYLVGVYDGVLALVDQACGRGADLCRVAEFQGQVERVLTDFGTAGPHARRPRLTEAPARAADVRAFLYRLFVYEHRQRSPHQVDALCAALPDDLHPVACGDALVHLARRNLVWALHCVYVELDRNIRASVLTANLQYRLQRARLETNLDAVLLALEPYLDELPTAAGSSYGGDRRAWLAGLYDRLLSRALAVEREDEETLRGLGPRVLALNDTVAGIDVTDALQMARVVTAGGVERGDLALDFDAGSNHRLLGAWAWPANLLVPHYIVGDPIHGGLHLGWAPHLRLRWLRGAGRATRWYERLAIAAEYGLSAQDSQPHFEDVPLTARLAVGVGYDPVGRLVDDLDLILVHGRSLECWRDTANGLELNVRLATKLRLGLGLFELGGADVYVTVGVVDWFALLWGLWDG